MDWEIIIQLVVAVCLGGIIGLEREFKKKQAGLQTYSLVSLGSCLLVLIGFSLVDFFNNNNISIQFDPLRLIVAVATGIGFIGAGVIIYKQDRLEGITTAAGLWVAAAIGVAVGVKLYILSIAALILTTIILIGFGEIERVIFNHRIPFF